MPAVGEPVESITMSMSCVSIKARASEKKLRDEMALSDQPTLRSD